MSKPTDRVYELRHYTGEKVTANGYWTNKEGAGKLWRGSGPARNSLRYSGRLRPLTGMVVVEYALVEVRRYDAAKFMLGGTTKEER